jgi:hypothetical protein
MCMLASKYSRIQKVQSFKIYFLYNSPLVQLHNSHRCWKRTWKQFCESLFSSSFAFLMMPLASQKRHPSNADFSPGSRKIWAGARSWEYGGCYSVVTLFFTKQPLNTIDRCAGALSWRRNQMLVLHFSWNFLLTASSTGTKDGSVVYLFRVAIPGNYTSETGNIFFANTCISTHSQFQYHMDTSVQYHFQIAYPQKEPRIHWIRVRVGLGFGQNDS